MAFKIDIKEDFEKEVKAIKTLKKDIKEATEKAADVSARRGVTNLKAKLNTYVTSELRMSAQLTQQQALPSNVDIPLARAEIVKQLFGYDLRDSNFIRSQLGDKTVNDLNNIFVVKDKRLKVWQGIGDSSTLSGELNRFRGRIRDGVIMDYGSGKFYLPNPTDIEDLKLECSKDTGITLDSEKKFEAYKNSEHINRRGATPKQRVAVMTMLQDSVEDMMRSAIPIDYIIDNILAGDFEEAKEFLSRFNRTNAFDSILERIDEMKVGKNLPESSEAFNNLLTMVRTLGIKKVKKKNSIDYVLTSSVINSGEDFQQYYDKIKQQISMWLVDFSETVINNVVKYITKSLKKYEDS